MVKVTFKTVQGSNFHLDLDASTKVLMFDECRSPAMLAWRCRPCDCGTHTDMPHNAVYNVLQ